jgi:hypothetical protein
MCLPQNPPEFAQKMPPAAHYPCRLVFGIPTGWSSGKAGPGIGNWNMKLENRNWKLENRNWKMETGKSKLENRK